MVKTLSELYLDARRAFMERENEQYAGLLARNLLCHATGRPYEAVIADGTSYASKEVCAAMEAGVQRVLSGEPLAYVLGQWDFYGMTLFIDRNVLIPRDDTCAVTDLAIKQARTIPGSPRIMDLCTGSGCIGLAVASCVKNAQVLLADLSCDALAVAKKNVAAQSLSHSVSCMQIDALGEPSPSLGEFDLIVSNPPYITTEEMEQLEESVKDYEPHMALHGGADGLLFYRAIVSNFRQVLKPGGCLCLEFGMGQGDAVCALLEENGYTVLERSSDYNEIERAVIARYDRKEDGYGDKKNSV